MCHEHHFLHSCDETCAFDHPLGAILPEATRSHSWILLGCDQIDSFKALELGWLPLLVLLLQIVLFSLCALRSLPFAFHYRVLGHVAIRQD